MVEITLKDKTFPILFSLESVEQIQARYGEIGKVSEKLQDVREIKWLLMTLINQGILYQAYMTNVQAKLVTEQDMNFLLTLGDLHSPVLTDKIIEAFNESLGSEKNLTAEQLMEIGKTTLPTNRD